MQKKERSTPKGRLDKTGKSRKFSWDLESNWLIKNNKAYLGLKEHASVDTNHFHGETESRIWTDEFDYSIVKNIIKNRKTSWFEGWTESCYISLNLMKQNWFLGVGLGGTLIEFGRNVETFPKKYNAISLYLADTGLVGVFFIINNRAG